MIEDEPLENSHSIKPETLDANRRWIRLMSAQADIHRQNRDPRLYRQSAQQKLIAPPSTDK